MKLLPSDPDIKTIVGRIKDGDMDLQPDFQRGEVWSIGKQKRLIDSILRDWHVPPIHVVQNPDTNSQDVLDGQQRLVAIRDFVNGLFAVDGRIEPLDQDLEKLHGLRYEELPTIWRRQFDQFTIRVFKIVDFKPEEPAELFFRLNQPVALTSAEQRNAFYGPVRTQVKELVDLLIEVPFGFSNSRMALDDVVARVCIAIESRTITKKLTASQLTERYRSKEALSNKTLLYCQQAVYHFVQSSEQWDEKVKLNKATLFSWLWASACLSNSFAQTTRDVLAKAVVNSERIRSKDEILTNSKLDVFGMKICGPRLAELIQLYNDRSSSRVSDVSSVIARDVVLWIFIADAISQLNLDAANCGRQRDLLLPLLSTYVETKSMQAVDLVNELLAEESWGQLS